MGVRKEAKITGTGKKEKGKVKYYASFRYI
jgi:hypothetical protein